MGLKEGYRIRNSAVTVLVALNLDESGGGGYYTGEDVNREDSDSTSGSCCEYFGKRKRISYGVCMDNRYILQET